MYKTLNNIINFYLYILKKIENITPFMPIRNKSVNV